VLCRRINSPVIASLSVWGATALLTGVVPLSTNPLVTKLLRKHTQVNPTSVDTGVIVAIPDVMDAGLDEPLFWGSLAFALLVAGAVAFPVNMWLIRRGRGHAVVHGQHDNRSHPAHGDHPR